MANIEANQSAQDAYANAGVDINAGNRAVSLMANAVRSTYGKEVLAGIGAFGGMYHATAIKQMDDPVLVASTDGIGTKVHLAAKANRWKSLGYDIVHHSVNDILVQGAKPLFFLDYLASSKLDPNKMAEIVTGMAEACKSVGCALLGGETAEMPGVYLPDMCDVAGTIVGIVERDASLPKPTFKSDDVLLGLASSGPHTNGYSLIRKIFADIALDKIYSELGRSLADALLAPHRCYLPILEAALYHADSPIKGLVHITGGGFFENIPRVLPDGLGASLNTWPIPELFKLIQKQGNIELNQMYHVFNMGIGMVIITAPENIDLLKTLISEPLIPIGKLVSGEKRVIFQ
jgi:phosphoribosylformylglycinamidine cyclo-ligase